MEDQRTITVSDGHTHGQVMTLKEYVKTWVSHVNLFRLTIFDYKNGHFTKTNKMAERIEEDIKRLAEYNFNYLYDEQDNPT